MKTESISSYFNDTDRQVEPSFAISTLGSAQESYTLPRSRSGHYILIYLSAGEGTYSIDHHIGHLHKGQALLIHPDCSSGLNLNKGTLAYHISFSSAFLSITDQDSQSIYQHIQQIYQNPELLDINPEDLEDIQVLTQLMLREYSTNNLFRTEVLKRYFRIILIYLSRQYGQADQLQRCPRSEQIIEGFMAHLEKHFRTEKMVSHYADALAVTPNYLNEVIKKLTGKSAGYHIRQRVALEAKRQAAFSNMSMKHIAYELGFCDMSHFSKFFKNTTGKNFSDYKHHGHELLVVA